VTEKFFFIYYFALVWPRRTTAEQEVLALIVPLDKLSRFEEAADFFSS